MQGKGLTGCQGQCRGWREAGMGGRWGQGECLDFGLIMQGLATLWLFGNTLALVWEQMSCGLSGAGRR